MDATLRATRAGKTGARVAAAAGEVDGALARIAPLAEGGARVLGLAGIAALPIAAGTSMAAMNRERLAAGELPMSEVRKALNEAARNHTDNDISAWVKNYAGQLFDADAAKHGGKADPAQREEFVAQFIDNTRAYRPDGTLPNDFHLMRGPDGTLAASGMGDGRAKSAVTLASAIPFVGREIATDLAHKAGATDVPPSQGEINARRLQKEYSGAELATHLQRGQAGTKDAVYDAMAAKFTADYQQKYAKVDPRRLPAGAAHSAQEYVQMQVAELIRTYGNSTAAVDIPTGVPRITPVSPAPAAPDQHPMATVVARNADVCSQAKAACGPVQHVAGNTPPPPSAAYAAKTTPPPQRTV
jgi:hypothetical protein